MTPPTHSYFIPSSGKRSFEAASCHDLTTRGLNSRCHVPRQVTEALSLSTRYINAQACAFPPFQSTNMCSLGISCTRTRARQSKLSTCLRFPQSFCRSCDVSANDSRCDQLHVDWQCRKSSSALIMKEMARCCKARLLAAKTAARPLLGSTKFNQGV